MSFFFVAASRNADMTLHLAAGEQLSELFFSLYRIKYKRLWPRYISDMHDLRTTYPDTRNELVAEFSQSARMESLSPLLERPMPVNI